MRSSARASGDHHPPAALGLPRGGQAGDGRGSAAQPGEERDRGVRRLRLFVAADPDAALRGRLAADLPALRSLAPRAKWVAPEGWHLTLAFLGSVEETRVDAIASALLPIAAAAPPMRLSVEGLGTFGGGRRPRVLWAGIGGESQRLVDLASEVRRALAPLGFAEEARPFSPHLTLARARHPRGDVELAACRDRYADGGWGSFELREIVLYRSELSQQGARYTPLHTLSLGG